MDETKETILIIDDNEDVLRFTKRMFLRNDYNVLTAENIEETKKILAENSPDILILDILLPDGNGLDALPELKELTTAPVLLLSNLSEPKDVVKGLMDGGDDYMRKPYDLEELLARTVTLLRKEKKYLYNSNKPMINYGDLTLDLVNIRAFYGTQDLELTLRDFSLLAILVQHKDSIISSEELYSSAWGMDVHDETRAVRKQISRLRIKLEDKSDGKVSIISEYGKGYRIISK